MKSSVQPLHDPIVIGAIIGRSPGAPVNTGGVADRDHMPAQRVSFRLRRSAHPLAQQCNYLPIAIAQAFQLSERRRYQQVFDSRRSDGMNRRRVPIAINTRIAKLVTTIVFNSKLI
ncbi:hypothetical protein TNCV_3987681 [Trichonephila clavipes]|nr:hypothetical protein TNCV_3987681 [Trichonephila clavipes]